MAAVSLMVATWIAVFEIYVEVVVRVVGVGLVKASGST